MNRTKFDDLPWEEIKGLSEKGLFEEVYKSIPKERLTFATKEENREILVNSALKSLRKKDPEASYEQANILADLMQTFARKMLER